MPVPLCRETPANEVPAALLAFADGAYATGKDALLSSAPCENVWLKPAAGTDNSIKMRSPLLTGIRGNLGRYIIRGVRAVAYIAGKQKKAK